MRQSLTGFHVNAFPFLKFEHSQKGRKEMAREEEGGGGGREKESKEEGREGRREGRKEEKNEGREGGRKERMLLFFLLLSTREDEKAGS